MERFDFLSFTEILADLMGRWVLESRRIPRTEIVELLV